MLLKTQKKLHHFKNTQITKSQKSIPKLEQIIKKKKLYHWGLEHEEQEQHHQAEQL